MELSLTKTRSLILCGIFTGLIAVGAFMKVPIPVLPFTLQFLFTTLAGLLLGGRDGAISVLIYLALGLAGLPIFASGGGLGYILQPTFGYLIGFALATYVTGKLANSSSKITIKKLLIANFVGLLIVYFVGMVYYYVMGNYVIASPIGLKSLIIYCFLLAVPGDIIICIVSAFLGKRLIPVLRGIS